MPAALTMAPARSAEHQRQRAARGAEVELHRQRIDDVDRGHRGEVTLGDAGLVAVEVGLDDVGGERRAVLELDALTQLEGERGAVVAEGPLGGQAGLGLAGRRHVHQAVVGDPQGDVVERRAGLRRVEAARADGVHVAQRPVRVERVVRRRRRARCSGGGAAAACRGGAASGRRGAAAGSGGRRTCGGGGGSRRAAGGRLGGVVAATGCDEQSRGNETQELLLKPIPPVVTDVQTSWAGHDISHG